MPPSISTPPASSASRTAELHFALASENTPTSRQRPAFTAESPPPLKTSPKTEQDRIAEQTTAALTALEAALPTLPTDIAAPLAHPPLLAAGPNSLIRAQLPRRRPHHSTASAHPHPRRLPPRPAPSLPHGLPPSSTSKANPPSRSTNAARSSRRSATSPACSAASATPPAPPSTPSAQRHTLKSMRRSSLWATAWENAAANAFLLGYRDYHRIPTRPAASTPQGSIHAFRSCSSKKPSTSSCTSSTTALPGSPSPSAA